MDRSNWNFSNLVYQIDNRTPVAYRTGIANTTPGVDTNWEATIPTSALNFQTANIKFYVVNNVGTKSNEESIHAEFHTTSSLTNSIKTLENEDATTLNQSNSYLVEMSYRPNQILVNKTIRTLLLRSTITGPVGSVSDLSMVNQHGVVVGTGTYNPTTRIVEGTLNAGTAISSSDQIFLRYTLTIADQVTEGETLRIDFHANSTTTSTNEVIESSTEFLQRTVRAGFLEFTSAPVSVNYGTNAVSVTKSQLWPAYSEPVTITDTRENGSAWRLKLAETSALSNGSISLAGDHFFTDGSANIVLSTADIIVAEGGNEGSALEVTANWNETNQRGLYLDVPVQKQSTTAPYKGTLRWTLEDVPGN